MKKKRGIVVCMLLCALSLCGCSLAGLGSKINDIKGKLRGNSFQCYFYTNTGEKFMTVQGDKIGMESNIVKDTEVKTDGKVSEGYSMSSVVTITVDGKQIENCGDTVLFEEEGLEPDADFQVQDIDSEASGLGANTSIANIVNKYKNYFGKSSVVIIQSQLGDPICAYSGDDVYWEVCEDLPKTTKLMIDGKALYIHRANFQIVDTALLK
ncbi:MAG: DUF5052 family protein [Lachnospiraceae bacterium]